MCAGNEAFYAALYLLHFTEGPICEWRLSKILWIDALANWYLIFFFRYSGGDESVQGGAAYLDTRGSR